MSEILLQLLVFVHATGDLTIHVETGDLRFGISRLYGGSVGSYYSTNREDIDKAVAEQFGRKPKPPYIERRQHANNEVFYVFVSDIQLTGCVPVELPMGGDEVFASFQKCVGKELSVVDASESQPVSTWVKVFPPEADTFTKEWIDVPLANTWKEVTNHLCEQMQKETAFTVWRLTVTR